MAALEAGTQAPQFELPAMDGSKFSLQDALTRGPVLAVFFKNSCPVCQYALPYFERIYKTYGKGKLSIVGISQNDKKDTAEFMKRYGMYFSNASRRHQDLTRFECIRADQCPYRVLDFGRRRNRNLERRMVAPGLRRNCRRRRRPLMDRRRSHFSSPRSKSPISALVEAPETSPQVAGT